MDQKQSHERLRTYMEKQARCEDGNCTFPNQSSLSDLLPLGLPAAQTELTLLRVLDRAELLHKLIVASSPSRNSNVVYPYRGIAPPLNRKTASVQTQIVEPPSLLLSYQNIKHDPFGNAWLRLPKISSISRSSKIIPSVPKLFP